MAKSTAAHYSAGMKKLPPVTADKYIDLLLDAVCVVDSKDRFLFVSGAGERIFGYRPDEMVGRYVMEFVHPEDQGKTSQAITEILGGVVKPCFENRYIRKDGTVAHIMWSARWSENEQIRVAVARDITEQKLAESQQQALYERLEHMAHYDQLTDLPNRALILDRLKVAISRVNRSGGHLAVLYLDLNNFKQVNDTHGHSVGDELLRVVARRLQSCIRESDTVGRMGGDEFVVLVDGLGAEAAVSAIQDKIAHALAGPVFLSAGVSVDCAPSIGYALFPDDGTDDEALIRHADKAMYRSKRERSMVGR